MPEADPLDGATPVADPLDGALPLNSKLRRLPKGVPTAEQEALRPVPEDPVYEVGKFAAKHPYVTAAVTGAAIGPTVGLGEAVSAVPGAEAAAGAAENLGYQKLSEKHPWLALVAPFAPRAALAAGGAQTAIRGAVEAETGHATQEQVQQSAEHFLGMSAPDAAALAHPTDVNAPNAQKLSQSKQMLWALRRNALKAVGREYDPIFEKVEKLPVEAGDLADISTAAKDAQDTVRARGAVLAPSVKKLLDEVGGYSSSDKLVTERVELPDGSIIERRTPKQIDSYASAVDVLSKNNVKLPATATKQELINLANQVAGTEGHTIGSLRGTLQRILHETDQPRLTATDRGALFDASRPIVRTLDAAIPDGQKPVLAAINAKYAQVNKIYPFTQMRKMNQAATLPELGKAMFEDMKPATTSMAIGNMSDAEKGLAREAFASWAFNSKDLFKTLEDQRDNMAALGFRPELQQLKTWQDLVTGAQRMAKLPDLPRRREFLKGVREEMARRGFSQEAFQAADTAMQNAAKMRMPYILRYATTWGALGLIGGYGAFGHYPELAIPLAAYAAIHFPRMIVSKSRYLPLYNDMLMAGWTQNGGRMFARAMIDSAAEAQREGSGIEQDAQQTGSAQANK